MGSRAQNRKGGPFPFQGAGRWGGGGRILSERKKEGKKGRLAIENREKKIASYSTSTYDAQVGKGGHFAIPSCATKERSLLLNPGREGGVYHQVTCMKKGGERYSKVLLE